LEPLVVPNITVEPLAVDGNRVDEARVSKVVGEEDTMMLSE
jgi:hypothetical protein